MVGVLLILVVGWRFTVAHSRLLGVLTLKITGFLIQNVSKVIITFAWIFSAPVWAAVVPASPSNVPATTGAPDNIPAIKGPAYSSKNEGVKSLCDFCTDQPNAVAAHVDANTPAGGPATGESSLFGRHNLTPTGANTGEICAFCHTPQGAEYNVYAPRWNRTLTTLSSYRAFSSLGSAAQEATGSISMACLSCHDGSQAPNIVINTPTLRLDAGNVRVDIGNTLRNHHPVGIQYAGGGQNQNAPEAILNPVAALDNLVQFNRFATGNKFLGNKFSPFPGGNKYINTRDLDAFADVRTFSNEGYFDSATGQFNYYKGGFNKSTFSGTGSGTVWWVKPPGSQKYGRQKTDLYLFTRTDTIDSLPSESILNRPYVECATCHDPHSTNSTFLRMPGGNARSQICLTCHNK